MFPRRRFYSLSGTCAPSSPSIPRPSLDCRPGLARHNNRKDGESGLVVERPLEPGQASVESLRERVAASRPRAVVQLHPCDHRASGREFIAPTGAIAVGRLLDDHAPLPACDACKAGGSCILWSVEVETNVVLGCRFRCSEKLECRVQWRTSLDHCGWWSLIALLQQVVRTPLFTLQT